MKTIVIYDSLTGHTQKIAKIMAAELNAKLEKVTVKKMDLSEYDLICVGTGTYANAPSNKIKYFLDNLPNLNGKKAIAFATYAAERTALDTVKRKLTSKGAKVVGDWGCNGSFLYFINWGRPDDRDLESARKFAREIKTQL